MIIVVAAMIVGNTGKKSRKSWIEISISADEKSRRVDEMRRLLEVTRRWVEGVWCFGSEETPRWEWVDVGENGGRWGRRGGAGAVNVQTWVLFLPLGSSVLKPDFHLSNFCFIV